MHQNFMNIFKKMYLNEKYCHAQCTKSINLSNLFNTDSGGNASITKINILKFNYKYIQLKDHQPINITYCSHAICFVTITTH